MAPPSSPPTAWPTILWVWALLALMGPVKQTGKGLRGSKAARERKKRDIAKGKRQVDDREQRRKKQREEEDSPSTKYWKLNVDKYCICGVYNRSLQASSAYWRGNKDRDSLQRVYGISYPDKKRLKENFRSRRWCSLPADDSEVRGSTFKNKMHGNSTFIYGTAFTQRQAAQCVGRVIHSKAN